MKFKITKNQYFFIKEIHLNPGKYSSYPQGTIFESFIDNPKYSMDKLIKLTKDYFKKVASVDISNMSNVDIMNYLKSLTSKPMNHQRRNKLYTIGVISGLSYYLSSKLKGLTKSNYGIEYFEEHFDTFYTFWFFDPEVEDFIGRIVFETNEDYPNAIQIVLSEIDNSIIGKGYGTKLYLTMLDNYDYMLSDKILYKDSLNIWVNSLPRYRNVWAKIKNSTEYVKITKNNLVDPSNVSYFICSKHSEV